MSAPIHTCPVCGKTHAPTRAQAEMALGGQLRCSPACEAEDRRRARARQLKSWQTRTEFTAIIVVFALLGIVLAIKWA